MLSSAFANSGLRRLGLAMSDAGGRRSGEVRTHEFAVAGDWSLLDNAVAHRYRYRRMTAETRSLELRYAGRTSAVWSTEVQGKSDADKRRRPSGNKAE